MKDSAFNLRLERARRKRKRRREQPQRLGNGLKDGLWIICVFSALRLARSENDVHRFKMGKVLWDVNLQELKS
jgi:hypothetical protein